MTDQQHTPQGTEMFLTPQWPVPGHVVACTTTRIGGVSQGPYHSLNMAAHVGDADAAVEENRRRVRELLRVPGDPCWLRQVHGRTVVDAARAAPQVSADAAYTSRSNLVCVVLTADCLPLLLCSRSGDVVAAVHVGWRGLVAGIIQEAVAVLPAEPRSLMAWLGPAIGEQAYEVGEDVRQAVCDSVPDAGAAVRAGSSRRWHVNLYALAGSCLRQAGVEHIYGGTACTYSDAQRFYSHRRDGVTGRMATMIWMADKND